MIARSSPPRRAFSLAEMLIAISIILLLVALITPALLGIVDSSHLKVATSTVADALSHARQTAITSNRAVEVRLYQIPRENAAPDAPVAERVYRALALYRIEDTGPRQLGPLIKLKGNVKCAEDTTHGTLIFHTPEDQSALPEQGGSPGTPYNYRYFIIRADGSTTLPPTTPSGDTWHLVLYNGNRPLAKALEGNYGTIQMDPGTARPRTIFPGQ